MSILAEYMIIADADNRPPMLDKAMYDSWESCMELFVEGKENGRMMLNSVKNLIWPTEVDEHGNSMVKKLDFGEGPKEKTREDSHHSSTRARTTKSKRLKVQDRLRYGDRHVLDRLGHRRQSAFDRLSKTYSPSTTKSRPRGTDFKDRPWGRSRPHRLDTSNEDCPKDKERFYSIRRDNESPLSSVSKSDSSDGRYQKSRSKRHKSTDEDDLTRPWMCEEKDPFTPRIRNFETSQRTQMPNNIKTYDGTGDPEDHVKIFQAAAQVEQLAMPTWCHMFNSTLIGAARVWFDELSPKSIDSYKDLKAAFLAYFMQQKKYVKDPVEIHNIKQKDRDTIEDFIERFKVETERMKGAPKCMRISRFMHGDQSKRQTSDKRSDFRGHSREGRGSNRFTPLTRTLKEILAAEAGKFQASPPMVTPVEKISNNKFCDFHNDKGHNMDECMQLKKQIEELVRAGKLSHLIKEIKHGRDQSKTGKKETPAKDKPTTIYMIQSWQRMTRQKVTQSFEQVKEITFPPLTAISETEGPLVIEAEMGRHMIYRMYVDGGSSMEILYEHCFNRLRPEIKSQMVPATTSLTGFSGETICRWDSSGSWIREIQAVPSTSHGMLKFLVEGGIVTISSTILIPTKYTLVITSSAVSKEERTRLDNFKVSLHPDFPDQEVAIRGTLSEKRRTELCSILKKNLDIFAWQPSDMTGVPRSVAEHRLNIREGYSPVRQKKKGQVPKRAKAIQAEVQKLVEAEIMREDYYPLPEIDWKVKSLYSYPFKCFLDDYKGYQQIQLAESNEEKTAFHTGHGVYCYTKMPFGPKNAGATYQRLMDKAFNSQIGRNIEVTTPKKCTFGVAEGVFLGYVVTPDGIKTFPDKTTAVLQLPSPRTIKEVQGLNGKLASLNRFLFKSAEKSFLLFKTLKKCIKKSDFHWIMESKQAFKQLKQHLSELPLLVVPKPKEELIIYLSATYGAISAVLMTKRGVTQTPIYFISLALQGPELNYTPMKKLVLSLVFAAKRLRRYFQAHPITVITDQPIKQIMSRPDILADFLIEMPDENPQAAPVAETQQEPWTLFTDGSSSSNNEAEYEVLIAGLRIATQMGVQNVHVSVDSKLVANQVLGTYVAKEENMVKYLDKVKSLVRGFTNFSISQVPQSKNKKADALSKIASTSFAHLSKQVLLEVLKDKSIKEKEVTTVVEEDEPTLMTSIVEYLKEGTLLSDRKEARKLRIKARQYELINGILYRRSFLTPWLRCVGPLQAEYMIREIHEGSCSMHAGPRSVGIDIAGPFPEGPGKVKFLIITMDYFTKWIEAKAVATITGSQSNGLAERANRSLEEGIKARLGEGNKNWVEELPSRPLGPSYNDQIKPCRRLSNDEELRLNLDLLGERCERAAICEAKAKLKMIKYYNARVRGVTFRLGDFVCRSNDASHAVAGGKLGPK
uniref:RNase H type-1 domain-containing protein n=1 Tax=Tanacetum cinerariifolium TaxID=118510 RepID=A0A699GQ52_TANCI|nr:hypothetical protein [Tanacetum cinerariifolium]